VRVGKVKAQRQGDRDRDAAARGRRPRGQLPLGPRPVKWCTTLSASSSP